MRITCTAAIGMDVTKQRLEELEEELSSLDATFAKLMQQKADLEQASIRKPEQKLSASALKHYDYILPLVKEIYLLELKIKEEEKAYKEKKWKCEAVRLGQDLLAASLTAENSVLKRWATELSQIPATEDGTSVTNRSYKAWHCDDCLAETLSFTVLSQGVHVGLRLKTEVPCKRILFLRPSSLRFGFISDTFIPGLEEKLKFSLSNGDRITGIVSMVATYIQEEMAPFVIIVPTKKKSKAKQPKPSQSQSESAGASDQSVVKESGIS